MGHRRGEFLSAVEASFNESEDTWRALLLHGRPDEIFQHMEATLVRVGQQYFGHQVSNDPLYRQEASERAELLRERARLRRSRIGMEEESE